MDHGAAGTKAAEIFKGEDDKLCQAPGWAKICLL